MKVALFIMISLVTFSSSNECDAGLFRNGKVFPLVRNRIIINDRQPTPATPNPPPIVTVAPQPIPQSPPVLKPVEVKAEETPAPISKLPPWLPLGSGAAGAGVALLAFLRRAITSI